MRRGPFDTELTEQEGSVMVVFRVYLQSYGILLQNAGSLLSSCYPTTSLAVSIHINDFTYRNGEHKPLVIRVVHQNREDEKNSEFFEID